MAVMIPESISASPATAGEKRVFKILKDLLPENYIVWFDLRVKNRYPDFIILGPNLGIVILEVKDWQINSITSADANNFVLKTMGSQCNPLKQARDYMCLIVNKLKENHELIEKTGRYKGNLLFTYGHGVIFTRIAQSDFLNTPFSETLDAKNVIFNDQLKAFENDTNQKQLIENLNSMVPIKFQFNPLSPILMDRIRGTLFKEVTLSSDSNTILKVMNIQQEQYAKSAGYGHRVIRGVAGSGKTVILLCRAKYLADTHRDWNILLLCFNITLATFLRYHLQKDGYNQVEVHHFHNWVNPLFARHNLNYVWKDQELTENISKITDEILSTEKKYDAILVDEGQDFDQEWLKFIVRRLRDSEESHLVLASDGAQNLYNRKYTLKSVGIKAIGRTTIMRENYRNTRQILNFAHNFLTDGNEQLNNDIEDSNYFIKPDTNLRSGNEPLLYSRRDFPDEVNTIIDSIIDFHNMGIEYHDICVLYHRKASGNIFYLNELENIFKQRQIPFFTISKDKNSKSTFKMNDGTVKISTIHSVKGLDFKVVFITGLNDSMVKNGLEKSKKLLYVGMTRARDFLNITYSVENDISKSMIMVHSRHCAGSTYPQKINSIKDHPYIQTTTIGKPVKAPNEGSLFSKIVSFFKRK